MKFAESFNRLLLPINKNLLPSQKLEILKALIRYTFKLDHFRIATKKLIFLSGVDRRYLRNASLGCFELSVAFKHAVYFIITNRIKKNTQKQVFIDFGVDIGYYHMFCLFDELGLILPLKKKSKLIKEEILSPKEFRISCNKAIKEINTFVNKYVYRKMRFILTSNNMDAHDISNELITKAVQTYYFSSLFYEEKHRMNIVKRSIVNDGVNTIKYNTTKAHSRLRANNKNSNETSWENLVQSLYVKDKEGNEVECSYSNDRVIEQELFVIKDSINKIESKTSGRKRKLVNLLLCKNDVNFVTFYNEKRIKRKVEDKDISSTEDVYHNCNIHSYMENVREYLQVDEEPFDEFIDELRIELAA